MTISDLELKLIRMSSLYGEVFMFYRNLRYSIENPEILFCRNCGEFELHKWKPDIFGLPDYLICVECATLYS
jgi:hypothetical protein